MPYQVIAGGRVAHNLGDPTYPAIVDVLGDLPICVPLPDSAELPSGLIVAWVGDNYIQRENAGEIDRDVAASVMMWNLGAPKQPYAGVIVLTGITENPWDGKMPAPMTTEGLVAIQMIMIDVNAVITGEGDAHPSLPDGLRTQFTADAQQIREMDYESMQIWKDVRF